MKNQASLKTSAKACINRAIRGSATLHTLLTEQKASFDEARMAAIRGYAQAVTRDVHEYNAYTNALLTE